MGNGSVGSVGSNLNVVGGKGTEIPKGLDVGVPLW